MPTIPDARGLAEELSRRIQNLIIRELPEEMAPDGIQRLTRYELFEGDTRLGVVKVNSYDRAGVRRVAHVEYIGRVPGYVNYATRGEEILMIANEITPADKFLWGRLMTEPRDVSKPNNSFFEPMCRYDRHNLELAVHEVDELGRQILWSTPKPGRTPHPQ